MPDTTADAGNEGVLKADNLTADSQTNSDQEVEDLAQPPGSISPESTLGQLAKVLPLRTADYHVQYSGSPRPSLWVSSRMFTWYLLLLPLHRLKFCKEILSGGLTATPSDLS